MSNGGIIGLLNEFKPSASGRWSVSNIRDYNSDIASVTPASIASLSQAGDLSIHYDFSDVSSIINTSGNVTQVNDLSGNSAHATQSNATYSPVTNQNYISTPSGSVNTLYFSGNKTLNVPSPPASQGVYFIVAKSANSSSTKYLMYQLLTNGTPGSLILLQAIVANNVLIQASTYYGNSLFASNIGTSTFLATYIYGPEFVEFRVNKNTVGSYPHSKPTYSGIVYLGSSNATGGSGWEGNVCELAFYDTSGGSADVKAIENYLYSKWIA